MTSMNSINIFDNKYSIAKSYIDRYRERGNTWEEINFACKGDINGLERTLCYLKEDFDVEISVDEWQTLVSILKKIEERSVVGYLGDPRKPEIASPTSPNSAWQKYKQKLIEKKFSNLSISNIETATKKIIGQISNETDQLSPVRGIVVGNVQSGKTANMAGVIAMAQDFGYNFFIVLTGTIESLRKQTEERLISDLDNTNCNFNLVTLRELSSNSPYNDRLQDLSLEEESNKRYLYVCLKNTTRLDNLLRWINKDKNKKSQLKVLILDDESDSAGVNTARIDQNLCSKINKQIKAMVFGQNNQFNPSGKYKCMNYIGYTATPYANFLNVATNDSLYPCNFILTLNSPEEYIGPQQIFGIEEINDGLPIVNTISDEECIAVRNCSFGSSYHMPSELKKAIYWFICTVACFRYWKLKKPVSMLIHTSQKIPNHEMTANLITNFLNSLANKREYLSEIKHVWNEQTISLSIERFLEELPDFPEDTKITNYPNFSEIEPLIEFLVAQKANHILLNEDETKVTYSEGIHICVDNCSNNKIEENVMLRLTYPDKNDKETLAKCPAFIVIGGATLSRGLTLEGLTTSYFLRSTVLGDSLMQMGRWFGYRKGYELLPRIWLSNGAIKQFERLTILDFDLREELRSMEALNQSPKEYAPRLDTFPDFKTLQITAKNKRQRAFEMVSNFANKKGQTTLFSGDDDIIKNNYSHTIEFINSLGKIDKAKIDLLKNEYANDKTLLWFDKPYDDVFDYLSKLKYPKQKATFGDVEAARSWFKEQKNNGYLKNFNILVSSTASNSKTPLELDNVTIYLPTRRKLKNKDENDTNINLKILTTPNDRLSDIDMSQISQEEKNDILASDVTSIEKRIRFKDFNTPLLILYVIDKDSGCNEPDGDRLPLNLNEHLVGYYIYIPYGNNGEEKPLSSTGKMTVKLEFDEGGDTEDDEDAN